VSLYLALLLAYIGVLRYMAGKPLDTTNGTAVQRPGAAGLAQGV